VIHALILAAVLPADCLTLTSVPVREGRVVAATAVEPSSGLPAYCRVRVLIKPAINFELRLPAEGWNGKFYMAGCGGFCGKVDADRPGYTNGINHALKRGYAVSSMDSGHEGTAVWDGRWALNNRDAEIDWGHRAAHVTAEASKALVQAFYGNGARYSYFAGCSTGGRMASMEASRYPDDFDGIVNGAPALDYTGLVATHLAWVVQANTDASGKAILQPLAMKLVAAAVYAACDSVDGSKDGLIDDPRACTWQPGSLACRAEATGCLSPAEVQVLERWYGGVKDSRGRALYPGGIPLGSEPYWPAWLGGSPSVGRRFADDFLRYMAFADDPGESYTALGFDFGRDPARLATMGAVYNADSPDLTAFRKRGGRMIMYHGWADPLVTPFKTLDYFAKASAKLGKDANETVRLFMLPGYDHCGLQQGPGAGDSEKDIDWLTALENWVEKGLAPETIRMTRHDSAGGVMWTREVRQQRP
jgi:hypothetical protein